MKLTRRHLLSQVPASLLLARPAASFALQVSPATVHAELVAGNRRFVAGQARHPHSTPAFARQTGRSGQHPHAVVLCCSDSRVSPEIVFDQGLGDLFVIRVAGNVLREDEIASFEYAVDHLQVPLCLILAHTGCGAVTAVADHEHVPLEVEHLVHPIQLAFEKVRRQYPDLQPHQLVDLTARLHALESKRRLESASPIFSRRIKEQRLRVEAAIYQLHTGLVDWL